MPTNQMEAFERQFAESMDKAFEGCTPADRAKIMEQMHGIESKYVLIEKKKMHEIIDTLAHSQVFISSRQKMHPTGQELNQRLLDSLREKLKYR